MQLRIGNGYDIHRLVSGRPLILGGQLLEHPDGLGLDGHSDADVLVHAIMDALLGALSLVVNVDSVVVAERPKLRPHITAMCVAVAASMGLEPDQVGIKATTNEKLGAEGREEGISCQAVALLQQD
jgi:2-C-methyl-D-erythritol 2,4-cyclodiphosphate synthase